MRQFCFLWPGLTQRAIKTVYARAPPSLGGALPRISVWENIPTIDSNICKSGQHSTCSNICKARRTTCCQHLQQLPARRWPSPIDAENQARAPQKSSKIRSKSLKIARFLLLAPHYQGQQPTFATFARLQAGSTINIVANICNERRQHPTSTVATFRSTFSQMVSESGAVSEGQISNLAVGRQDASLSFTRARGAPDH